MSDPRAELEGLRKLKRLQELEAKSQGNNGLLKNAMAIIPAYQQGLAKALSFGNLDLESLPLGAAQTESLKTPVGKLAEMYGSGAGTLGSGALMAEGAAALPTKGAQAVIARLLANPAIGGIQGALTKPKEGQSRLEKAKEDALLAAVLGTAGEAAAPALSKVVDVGMQAATGAKRFEPGVGNVLADNGIYGTSSQMNKSVAAAKKSAWDKLKSIAESNPGEINASEIAAALKEKASRPYVENLPSPSGADRPTLESIDEFAKDIERRGQEPMLAGLGRRRAAGERAYMGRLDPGRTLNNKLSSLEQAQYSSRLKSLDPSGEVANADELYSALASASRNLNKPKNIPQSSFGVVTTPIRNIPGLPLATSSVAQILNGASKAPVRVGTQGALLQLLNDIENGR